MKKQEEVVGKNLLENEGIEGAGDVSGNTAVESKEPKFKVNGPMKNDSRFEFFKSRKFLIICSVLVGLSVLTSVFLVIPALFAVRSAQNLFKSVDALSDPLGRQDLGGIKTGIEKIEQDLKAFDTSLTPLAWIKVVPVAGGYWSDARNGAKGGIAAISASKALIPALEPYADILGFGPSAGSGQAGADGAKTAEDRIDFIVEALPAVTPKLGEVSPQLVEARDSLAKIDANRYPEEFKGIPLRHAIKDVQSGITTFTTLVTDGKPLLEAMPVLLGMDKDKTYLVIFQNDKELRPTGGFMTAYSLMTVKKGNIEPVSSDDIYNLDKRYKPIHDAPKVFLDHIKQPYSVNPGWRLRDMNWSPDFKVSMDFILPEAKKAKLPTVDGIIAVDTNLLVSILEVTGRIGVPGQGNFSAEIDPRCDCPQVIYELESYADVEKPIVWDPNTGKIVFGEIVDNRKAILGPLVNSVLKNALAQPKTKVPELAQKLLSNLMEKHVVFYMFDENTQKALESFGIAGRIKPAEGDYLAIVDANIGGRKANLYATHEVVDNITEQNGKVLHDMVITYKNPQKHDGWLNSVLPDYMRVYVPKGAKLISADGVAGSVETTEELGKTVFAGFFELRPEGVVKVSLRYEVAKDGPYKILVQKQAGKGNFPYTFSYKGRTEEFQLTMDRELRFE